MRELTQLLGLHDDSVPLDVATLQLATIEYPEVTADPFLGLLDSHANELGERVEGMSDGEEFVGAMNEYFFDELGFEGNRADYYDPANSCLNEVLTRRKGIPITLSVVCMEVARRLERPLFGIALPGHFILGYNDGEFCAFIDPFNAGQLLCESECFELARRATGAVHDEESLLDPAANHQIVVRMLNNLRSAYIMREQPRKLLKVLDLLIQSDPESAEQYRQRGLVRARLEMIAPARQDLEKYLELASDSPDRTEVSRWLKHWGTT